MDTLSKGTDMNKDDVFEHLLDTCIMAAESSLLLENSLEYLCGDKDKETVDMMHRQIDLIALYRSGMCDKENLVKGLEIVLEQLKRKQNHE